MGVKKGQFVSKNGHTYEVRLSGTNVGNADILLGVPPVVISMAAGEHKFCGFKSTTAVVNILTDVPLVDLYASGVRDIRLTVEDKTSDSIEFDGYVTPFAFDQPYTGKLDSVQVNAVDLITARKDVPYANIGTPHGTDRKGLVIVQEICKRAGITTIVEHRNFNTASGESTIRTEVAQAGFLQDKVSDADALSAICKYFGYTGHAIGDTLYMYDEHVLHGSPYGDDVTKATVYRYANSAWSIYSTGSLTEQHLGKVRDLSVSVERAYDGVQITPEGSEVSVLLPDVCSEENTKENTNALGTNTRVVREDSSDGIFVQWRTPLGSRVMEFGQTSILHPDELIDFSQSQLEEGDPVVPYTYTDSEGNTVDPAVRDSAILMRLVNAKGTRDNDILSYSIDRDSPVIWIHNAPGIDFSATWTDYVGNQKESARYSHSLGYFRLNVQWFETAKTNWANLEKKPEGFSLYKNQFMRFVNIVCGGDRFISDSVLGESDIWGGEKGNSNILSDGGKPLGTMLGISKYTSAAVFRAVNRGQIYAQLRWTLDVTQAALSKSTPSNIYITQLSMEGVGDPINTEHTDLRHAYTDDDEYLEVSTMLTLRDSGSTHLNAYGVNARPSVVPSSPWSGYYLGDGSVQAGLAGILMVQLKARYGQPHAAYKMTADGNIKPFAAVEWNGNTYTVDAYDRDLYDDTTTITID